MKFASLQEIRKELQLLPSTRLQELCLRLARYKKENKELLAYLLFEEDNRQVFINAIKEELEAEMEALRSQNNLFYLKKGLRRVLRVINRYTKYMGDKSVSMDLLLFFCAQVKDKKFPLRKSAQLRNLYDQQIKKAETLIKGLHEDLRGDFQNEIVDLKNNLN